MSSFRFGINALAVIVVIPYIALAIVGGFFVDLFRVVNHE